MAQYCLFMAHIRLVFFVQEEFARKMSEDRHCFRPLVRLLVFFKHLCLHSLFVVAYVICNRQTKNQTRLKRLRVATHLSSGIVERAEHERA